MLCLCVHACERHVRRHGSGPQCDRHRSRSRLAVAAIAATCAPANLALTLCKASGRFSLALDFPSPPDSKTARRSMSQMLMRDIKAFATAMASTLAMMLRWSPSGSSQTCHPHCPIVAPGGPLCRVGPERCKPQSRPATLSVAAAPMAHTETLAMCSQWLPAQPGGGRDQPKNQVVVAKLHGLPPLGREDASHLHTCLRPGEVPTAAQLHPGRLHAGASACVAATRTLPALVLWATMLCCAAKPP